MHRSSQEDAVRRWEYIRVALAYSKKSDSLRARSIAGAEVANWEGSDVNQIMNDLGRNGWELVSEVMVKGVVLEHELFVMRVEQTYKRAVR